MTHLATILSTATVYPDRARVTRMGTVSLEAGLHRLEIPELPVRLNPESARAAARGTAQARLLGLQVQRAFFAETPAEAVRRLEEQVEARQDELKNLQARAERIKKSQADLAALASQAETYAVALASGEMTVKDQQALFAGLRGQSEALEQELQQAAAEQRATERQITKLKNELEQLRGARPRERYTAWVEVEVVEAGELSVELSYVVSGAAWKPLYDLRLLEDEGEPNLEIGYLAQVSQQTGESWDQVILSLSTARPALAGRVPELDPWYIQPLQPRILRSAVAVGAAPEDLAQSAVMMRAAPPPAAAPKEAEEVTAAVEAGAAVAYHIPAAVSIPADGAPHKVTIARYPLEPKLDYTSAPKLVQAAYRRAKVINDSPYTLLPGSANLFAGAELIGAANLEMVAPQGEIELYFGVDDRVRVERELKRREVDKRLIGGKRSVHYGYEITVENLLPTQAQVTVHDQLPVARHEDIKVRLESADPRPSEKTELNLLNWDLSLVPKEKRVVRFDFSVEYPQEMKVEGLV